MKPASVGFTLLFSICFLFLSAAAHTHGGRLNKDGCHNNRKTGDYHCHHGAKANPNIATVFDHWQIFEASHAN